MKKNDYININYKKESKFNKMDIFEIDILGREIKFIEKEKSEAQLIPIKRRRGPRAAQHPSTLPEDGLSLWLKADAGVTLVTSGPYTYVSQIVISGSNTPNVNGTYTATSVPTFDESGNPNDYNLVGPSYTVNWVLSNNYFYLQTGGFNEYWTSSDGVNWEVGDSITGTITISGSTTPNVNGVYTYFEPNYYGSTYSINTDYGYPYALLDVETETIFYTSSSPNGPWTIVDGSGAITSTSTLTPMGSITATKVVSSSAVTAWADQSGNGNNATSPAIPPTFVSSSINSKPAISFNNDSSWMQIPLNSIGNSGNISIFIVLNYVSGAVILNKGDAATFEATVWELTTNTGFGFVNVDGESYNWNTVSVSPATSTPLLLEGFSSVGVSQLAFNGTNSGDSSSANVGFNNLSQYIGIGGGGDGGASVSPLDARIAEIIIYNRQVTTTERQQVEAYLNAKYAIY